MRDRSLTRNRQNAGGVVDEIVHDGQHGGVGQPLELVVVQVQCGDGRHRAEHAVLQQGDFVVLQVQDAQVVQTVECSLRDTLCGIEMWDGSMNANGAEGGGIEQ